MASMDFGVIETDYAFFMAHSTEADNDLAALSHEVRQLRGTSLRLLDLGCGTGEFTRRVLDLLSWPPQQLHLSLVDPVIHQREQAVEKLGSFTAHKIEHWDLLPSSFELPFDLIVSNHVLYYVDDLPGTLRTLHESLAPGGRMILAMAPWRNFLMQLWQVGYAALGQQVPHNAAEQVIAALDQLGISHQVKTVEFEINFADSTENRRKILRFLFGKLLPKVGEQHLLAEFDRYTLGSQVKVPTESLHIVIEGDR